MMMTYEERERRAIDMEHETASIIEHSTMKLPTTAHLLVLRNLLAEAYRLLHHVQPEHESPYDSDIAIWQRRARVILDARIK